MKHCYLVTMGKTFVGKTSMDDIYVITPKESTNKIEVTSIKNIS